MLAGQAFKVVDERTRTFRGGPMYYMERGLGSRGTAMCFTLLLLFTFGLAFVALQSFTASSSLEEAFGIPVHVTGIAMTAIVAITIFGGVQRLSQIGRASCRERVSISLVVGPLGEKTSE